MGLPLAKDDRILDFHRYWDDLRQDADAPFLSDFDPIDVPGHLPLIWLAGWCDERQDYVYRVAGEAILAAHQCPMRGLTLTQIYRPSLAAVVRQRYDRICHDGCLYYAAGTIYTNIDRFGTGERVAMPMRDSDGRRSIVLGCTVSRVMRRPVDDLDHDPTDDPEIQAYMTLDGDPLPAAVVQTGQRTSA